MKKEYLGDGVYIEVVPEGLLLTTEDGVSVQNKIYLEGRVYSALELYVQRLAEEKGIEIRDNMKVLDNEWRKSLAETHTKLLVEGALSSLESSEKYKRVLREISNLSQKNCLTFESQSFEATKLAAEALK